MTDYTDPIRTSARRLVREMAPTDRPVTRLHHAGAEALSNAELLALVLGTADAHDLAQDILQATRSLRQLGRCTTAELRRFRGVGSALAGRILATTELARRMAREPRRERPRITSPTAAWELLRDMEHLEQEHLVVLSLNTRNELLARETVYVGNVNTSIVRTAEIVRRPIRHNAPAFILAHNHPSSDPSPSPEDVKITTLVRKAAELMDLDLLDHIIVGYQQFVSMKQKGLGFQE